MSREECVPAKKIPRPMNCFMTYRLEKQQQIVNQCPGANHRDISKIIAKWWRELSDAEKDPYRIKAAEAKAAHLERYPEYKYRP
ncbi:high mobility group box domain-containing protein, partial [Mucor mucedo]|uniref:high mobility group box domain-containing protein n=1 Tax=Mucor mucedo TaxID=29922 RepID=UPI00221F3A64